MTPSLAEGGTTVWSVDRGKTASTTVRMQLSGALSVDLTLGTAKDGFGGHDALSDFEEVLGSKFADVISGGILDESFEAKAATTVSTAETATICCLAAPGMIV